ncbi:hypothetical protein HKX42_00190 [Salinisphaera sp. USBA-960]|nr:hypothetical protein [Salifodinibacter halophilus]NNC25310.1 hypothetical protein [Salifodinibacter halophilus]
MDFVSNLGDYGQIALTVIGAAAAIVKSIATITDITPTTTDDRIVSRAQSVIKTLQTVLSKISGDTSRQAAKQT